MTKEEALLNFFDVSRPTLYKWKRDKRPVAIFIEKYLNQDDLIEFLETGKIEKLDYVNSYLNNLKNKCHKIYVKIEKMEIEYKNSNVNYESGSMLISQNLYRSYLSSFLQKYKETISNFKIENFKADFIALALLNPLEFKGNGVPEPLVTFQILSILDELSSAEMHYFFNEYDKIVHDF